MDITIFVLSADKKVLFVPQVFTDEGILIIRVVRMVPAWEQSVMTPGGCCCVQHCVCLRRRCQHFGAQPS